MPSTIVMVARKDVNFGNVSSGITIRYFFSMPAKSSRAIIESIPRSLTKWASIPISCGSLSRISATNSRISCSTFLSAFTSAIFSPPPMSTSLTKCPFCQGQGTNWTLDNLTKLSRVNSGSNLCSLAFHKLRRHLFAIKPSVDPVLLESPLPYGLDGGDLPLFDPLINGPSLHPKILGHFIDCQQLVEIHIITGIHHIKIAVHGNTSIAIIDMLKQFITEVSICQHFYQNSIVISTIGGCKCF